MHIWAQRLSVIRIVFYILIRWLRMLGALDRGGLNYFFGKGKDDIVVCSFVAPNAGCPDSLQSRCSGFTLLPAGMHITVVHAVKNVPPTVTQGVIVRPLWFIQLSHNIGNIEQLRGVETPHIVALVLFSHHTYWSHRTGLCFRQMIRLHFRTAVGAITHIEILISPCRKR